MMEATEPSAYAPVKRTRQRNRQRPFTLFFHNSKAVVGLCLFLLFVLIAIFAPVLAPYDPHSTAFAMSLPSAKHLFGTTNQGQDIFSQFVFGARTTLIVGVGAGILSTVISLLVGVTAGYTGGFVDTVLNFLSNIFLVLPGLVLLILIEALVKGSTPVFNGFIIGLTGWAWGARVFRAQTMSYVNRDFVAAAKLSGASAFRIMTTEIVPNMLSIVAANLMYSCLGAILAESGLAFLGLESGQSISWGTMLYWASEGDANLTGAWWWFVPPGLGIALVGLSLVLMNFAIDEITNPRLRGSSRRGVRVRRTRT